MRPQEDPGGVADKLAMLAAETGVELGGFELAALTGEEFESVEEEVDAAEDAELSLEPKC